MESFLLSFSAANQSLCQVGISQFVENEGSHLFPFLLNLKSKNDYILIKIQDFLGREINRKRKKKKGVRELMFQRKQVDREIRR